MQFNNKVTRSVADAVSKVMAEALKGDQHKIDANKNGKIDADDFKKLRKEDAEQLDELSPGALKSYIKGAKSDKAEHQDQKASAAAADDHKTASDSAQVVAKRQAGIKAAKAKLNKEEAEDLLEYESKDGVYRHQAKAGRYGGSEKEADSLSGVAGPSQKDLKKIESEKKKKKFSESLTAYKSAGIKGLFESLVKEEPDTEQFTKEVEKQKRKAAGTASEEDKAKVAAPASQGCVMSKEHVEQVEIIDMTDADNITKTTVDLPKLDERSLTAGETKKKEEVVKSMKKGISGFKDRYGDRAKSVMYATATKIAKKD